MSAARETPGAASLSISSHFPTIWKSTSVKPVMFPPGCAKLETKPCSTGSLTATITMGMELVVCAAPGYLASCDRQVRRARAPLVLLRELVCGRRRPHQSVSRFECCGRLSILILEALASALSLGPALPGRRPCPSAARSAARARPAARARRERPGGSRAAEQGDKLAPLQVIEHSVPSQGRIAGYRIRNGQSAGTSLAVGLRPVGSAVRSFIVVRTSLKPDQSARAQPRTVARANHGSPLS